jgi:molecular chaperone GrpE
MDRQPETIEASGAAAGTEPAGTAAETEVSMPVYSVSKENEESPAAWRDSALRLQAEMDNYRKRQRRIAQEEAQASQERLLHDVLRVADNLDRTLAAGRQQALASAAPQRPSGPGTSNGLRQGVELTRDDLLRVLAKHGIERFDALGEPFDPAWHEAVHVVSAWALRVEPGTVVEQVQWGYRKGERLFRPAQVVVAN